MPDRRLQIRLVSLSVSLTLLLLGVGYGLVRHAWLADARVVTETHLTQGAKLVTELVRERHQSLARAAERLATDDVFLERLAAGDLNQPLAAMTLERATAQAARMVVLTEGFSIKIASPVEFHQPRWERALGVQHANNTVVWIETMAAVSNQPPAVWLWAAARMATGAPDGQGRWVAAGTPLNDAELHRLGGFAALDLMLIAGSGNAPTTLLSTTPDLSDAVQLAADQPALGTDLAAPVWIEHHGASYQAQALLLLSSTEHGRIRLVMLSSLDRTVAPYANLNKLLAGIALGVVLVLGVASYVVACRIARPLGALSRSAARVAKGDYDSPIQTRSKDEIGDLSGAFENMRRAIRQRDGEIRRLAYRDTLTGLPNREHFRNDVRQALAASGKDSTPCAVLLLDLDRFKHVNDVLGHRFGDQLLRLVGERLRDGGLGSCERLARLGGDEFAVLLRKEGAPVATTVARRILRQLEQPFTIDNHTVDLGASIGIASSPVHATDPDQLIARAEIAMYEAKRQRSGPVTYDPAMESSGEESLSLLSELRLAMDNGELWVALQPKVNLASGALIGAETLLRWQHPTRGAIPPMQFIPFAEQTGFVNVLTLWILERALITWRTLHDQGTTLRLSVNLSTRDLMDGALPVKLERMLSRYQAPASALVLEITESAIMDDPERALQTLLRLHAMGIKLSIDDFGTGYSSLAYLKKLPVDELKIDQSFVFNMENDMQNTQIVRSTVNLAHSLGLRVVAEGVESAKAWKLLAGLACDEAQGYFIARPMALEPFVEWARAWAAPRTEGEQLDTRFAALI